MATCLLCGEHPDDEAIIDHIRVMHPAEYGDGPQLWPDARRVILDETAETVAEIGWES